MQISRVKISVKVFHVSINEKAVTLNFSNTNLIDDSFHDEFLNVLFYIELLIFNLIVKRLNFLHYFRPNINEKD